MYPLRVGLRSCSYKAIAFGAKVGRTSRSGGPSIAADLCPPSFLSVQIIGNELRQGVRQLRTARRAASSTPLFARMRQASATACDSLAGLTGVGLAGDVARRTRSEPRQ
jgi:hypothetical protein